MIRKDIGLLLVCRNSDALIFASLLLYKLVIDLFKSYSSFLGKLLWITSKNLNVVAAKHVVYHEKFVHLEIGLCQCQYLGTFDPPYGDQLTKLP